ncbi:MAG: metallophosphoesterase [Acidobacteriota bacterium]|nr:metallophosphoesterase [Acidobacteriota bacterium]
MRTIRSAAFFVAVSRLLSADFEAGKRAFEKGDYATARAEWRPLAEQGAPFAAYNLGLMCTKGQGGSPDPQQAAKWYRIAAEKGVPEAQYNLGVLYSNGTGVPKDYTQAAQWFQKAAEKGDVNAANNLGTLYDAGEGSFRNYAEAEKWYRKAAEEGNSNSQFNLGVMYDIGQGVKVDYREAEKWYSKAAERWNEGALCNLAILYYNGEGVERDLVKSHAYYLLAKEAGDPRASNLIELTTEKLSKKQLAQARAIAEEFKQSHQQQILAAKNPVQKPPSASSAGPEVAGAYGQVEGGTVTAKPVASGAAPPASAQAAGSGESVWTGVERVVAVGDLHGDYEQFAAVLRSAGVIDAQGNWAGGRTHLVQTGDVVDQGPDSRRIMDLLINLETQAKAAGGMVHCLIGNHEAMDVYGDLRFISPAGYQEYADPNSSEMLRDRAYEQYRRARAAYAAAKENSVGPEMTKQEWMQQHPPGFFEQREAFAPEGKYGKWIRSHDAVIRINEVLYSHAGLSAKYAAYTLDEINRRIRDELTNPQNLAGGMVTDLQGPLWYRGFSGADAPSGLELDRILRKEGAVREVVGHVDAGAAITPRYGNRVILIDVGLSRLQDNTGVQACLILEGNKMYAMHRGVRLEMPKDEGPDMLRYLKQAAALDPEPSPLANRIQQLEAK